MKKNLIIILLFVVVLAGCTKVNDEIKLGVARYAAHGTRSFAVTTVVMKGDIIESVIIDEYQFLDSTTAVCVPNGDSTFAKDTTCLASKRENNDIYSENMTNNGGATVELLDSYKAIENYAKGKTLEELTQFISGKTSEELVDAVTGSTLVDTKGYIESIIAAINSIE